MEHALNMAEVIPMRCVGQDWVMDDPGDNAARSHLLGVAARALNERGLIHGWRDEDYASWGTVDQPGLPGEQEWFRLERSMFRYMGLRSHAVHVNGFASDGGIWRARRALTKAVDPGLFDNLAAGGLAAGETVLTCAWRELYEEAGLGPEHIARLEPLGTVLTERMEPQGWHSESLTVFNAWLKPGVQPVNQDGEVMQFDRVDWSDILHDWRQHRWTMDAACVMALAGQS